MSFDEVILERRSIRKYKEESVNSLDISAIIKAGILAPSAHNRQPWKVKVFSKQEKEEIYKSLVEKASLDPSINNTAGIINEVPTLIGVFYNPEGDFRDHDLLSIGAFVENMHLKATDLGLGSLWIANTDYIKEEIKKIANCDLECVSCLAVGYKNQEPKMRPRKTLEEIIVK